MKSQLVFGLVLCLILAGTPVPTHSQATPKERNSLQSPQKMDSITQKSLYQLELKNLPLLNQKAGDSKKVEEWGPSGNNQKGGDAGLILLVIGAVAAFAIVKLTEAPNGGC